MYEGEFKKGELHGKGVYRFHNGDIVEVNIFLDFGYIQLCGVFMKVRLFVLSLISIPKTILIDFYRARFITD